MTTVAFMMVLICVTVVPGCLSSGEPTTVGPQTQLLPPAIMSAAEGTENSGTGLLAVRHFSLTPENLRLEYRVTNVFRHDIWVCANINQYANQDSKFSVETEIGGRTLRITRRGNMRQALFVNAGGVYAVYHRLPPGASRSDTVLLPLPVRGYSPVGRREPAVCPVGLNQVVLELGYFEDNLRFLLSEEEGPRRAYYGYSGDSDTAFISYIIPRKWDKLRLERSMRITIPDVNVPGLTGEH